VTQEFTFLLLQAITLLFMLALTFRLSKILKRLDRAHTELQILIAQMKATAENIEGEFKVLHDTHLY
jgi:hypothetical protein